MTARSQPKRATGETAGSGTALRLWSAGYGLLLAVALVKLGNPVVLDRMIARPTTAGEWWLSPWPMVWGWGGLFVAVVAGFVVWPRRGPWPRLPLWLWVAPVLWGCWVGLTALTGLDRAVSGPVVVHYGSVVVGYYLGVLLLGRTDDLRGFWLGLLGGMIWVLLTGFEQHYGGLEATRRLMLEQSGGGQIPPELLRRLEGGRVFATLFYANTLAGVILLLLPPLAVVCWGLWPERLRVLRAVSTGLLVYAGAACLVWSGSKAGWLIGALMGGVGCLSVPMSGRLKWGIALLILAVGLAGFGLRFQGYLRRGATSAVARVDYWTVAVGIVAERPILGSGPGTFERLYRERRSEDSEPTRVVHNDYLQQGSDSGLPAALLYGVWFLGGLVWCFRHRGRDLLGLATWLGLLGVAVQGVVEFGLLIPAVAWPTMSLLGWRVARTAAENPVSRTLGA